eukprot:4103250-Pleurochrysis_carterae.AAC.1
MRGRSNSPDSGDPTVNRAYSAVKIGAPHERQRQYSDHYGIFTILFRNAHPALPNSFAIRTRAIAERGSAPVRH